VEVQLQWFCDLNQSIAAKANKNSISKCATDKQLCMQQNCHGSGNNLRSTAIKDLLAKHGQGCVQSQKS